MSEANKLDGLMNRREFRRGAAAIGASLPSWPRFGSALGAQGLAGGAPPALDLAEWTSGYIGMETVSLPRGEMLTGKNTYVEVWTPMQGENNYSGPAQVQFLKQSGCDADFPRLRDLGIEGNTNLMLLERNNFEVFGVIRDWLNRRVHV
jgi:hypothetical protein